MSSDDATVLWFDESGHTGEDLLNADQPIFVLASSNLSHELAERLTQTYFAGVKAAELKYSALARTERGRRQILALLADPAAADSFGVDIWHKEFTLFTTLIDSWIETAMHRDGFDLYDRGGNIALANLTYMAMSNLLPKLQLRQHMLRYQTMMRTPTRESYGRFWGPLRALFDVSSGPLQD